MPTNHNNSESCLQILRKKELTCLAALALHSPSILLYESSVTSFDEIDILRWEVFSGNVLFFLSNISKVSMQLSVTVVVWRSKSTATSERLFRNEATPYMSVLPAHFSAGELSMNTSLKWKLSKPFADQHYFLISAAQVTCTWMIITISVNQEIQRVNLRSLSEMYSKFISTAIKKKRISMEIKQS